MDFLNNWVQGIIIAVVIATIIEMILPNGNNKKYVKIVLGIYIVFTIMSPIVNKVTKNNFEISSIINLEKYAKKFETYETSAKSKNIEDVNQNNIKKIYIANLEKDIKSKLKDKGYIAKKIDIQIKNDDEYQINEIIIEIDSNKKEIYENNKNINIVNEIHIVNIDEKDNIENNTKDDVNDAKQNNSKVTHLEKTEIIKYISDTYGINEKNITIY